MLSSRLGPAAAVAAIAAVMAAPTAQAQGQLVNGLVQAPGRPLVQRACTTCHAAAQVVASRRSGHEWQEVVDRMVEHGAKLSNAEYNKIVGYLTKYYGPKASAPVAKR